MIIICAAPDAHGRRAICLRTTNQRRSEGGIINDKRNNYLDIYIDIMLDHYNIFRVNIRRCAFPVIP